MQTIAHHAPSAMQTPAAATPAVAARDAAGMVRGHPLQRALGRQPYEPVWRAMREFTAGRGVDAADQLWWLEHEPVYTLGKAGRMAHIHDAGDTPVVVSDRGGQVTWHGPGQFVVYTLLDLRRLGLTVRALVRTLEDAVVGLLAEHGLAARGDVDRPGVYVGTAKIAALGLKVRGGCCYHGLSLNVDMDLSVFAPIDPCGYPGLAVTDLRREGVTADRDTLAGELVQHLMERLHG